MGERGSQSAAGTDADCPPSGIKVKVENKQQYEEYLEDLKSIREELGVNLSEDLYPNAQFH